MSALPLRREWSPLGRWFALALTVLALPTPARADGLLPPDKPIPEVVDFYIDAQLKEENLTPAPPADDANLLRRLTLDLAGRIPTVAETKAFLSAAGADKRERLVDRLMGSPAFVRHQANEFEVLLMDGSRASLRDYLAGAFAENRPWDRIFRELILPDQTDPKQKGANEFLRVRLKDLDKTTSEVSSLFFGVNVSCAQCHDHPLVPDWKQDHFYGMKSFFSRSYEAGRFVGERDTAVVKFKTTKGQERTAKLMFLTGTVVEEPPGLKPSKEEPRKGKRRPANTGGSTPPAPPKFSARAKLVELALRRGQGDFFARSIVNRVWDRLFGYGLVMPLDQMHSANPPSHPELMDWLARDVAEHGYDLRRLTRGLVLSRAYARSSRWDGKEAPKPALFAVARVRPLRPMQLATALRLATAAPDAFPAGLKADEFDRRLQGIEGGARGLAGLFEQPGEDFQVGVGEALLFSNGDRVQKELLADGNDRLVGRLKTIKDAKELAATAVQAVLSRPASAEEVKVLAEYVERRADRRVAACRQVVWALLTSAEFRFNY
jgi:hypothetical protein